MITIKMIKDHIKEREYLSKYGKGIKLVNVEFKRKIENSTTGCIAEVEATTLYNAKKIRKQYS